jgi:dephospho-CoA kinase
MRYTKVVINNDGDIDELKAKIKELWQRLNSE